MPLKTKELHLHKESTIQGINLFLCTFWVYLGVWGRRHVILCNMNLAAGPSLSWYEWQMKILLFSNYQLLTLMFLELLPFPDASWLTTRASFALFVTNMNRGWARDLRNHLQLVCFITELFNSWLLSWICGTLTPKKENHLFYEELLALKCLKKKIMTQDFRLLWILKKNNPFILTDKSFSFYSIKICRPSYLATLLMLLYTHYQNSVMWYKKYAF